MNELMRQLLDLDTLRWGMEGVRFGFERELPAWVWGVSIAGAIALALWSYSRLIGAAWSRLLLAGVRGVVLILLLFLAAGPQLVRRTESVEKDWVLVLVDRSASLTIRDAKPEGAEERVEREAELRAALDRTWAEWSELARDRTVVWLGFDAGAYDLGEGVGSIDLGEPDGLRTALGSAVDQALSRAAARPLSAVVVLTDGRSVDDVSRQAMRRLQSERVPVHTVALGSSEPVGDVGVRRVDAPSVAFVDDITPVRVDLERLDTNAPGGATVRLVDRATGMVLDERRVEFGGEGAGGREASVTLVSRSEEAGERTWAVEIEPDGADLIAGNNTREVAISLVDRPVRVLYIDGTPRWEQRYLRNMLLREESITSSSLILAPDRRYTQEGNVEIDSLPDSPERWAEYDVVILGDVTPEVFTYEQLAQMREHISLRGAGLIWIGGEGYTPRAWWETPLADLLPFVSEATEGGPVTEPVTVAPTPDALRLGVLRLGAEGEPAWPAELADPDVGWSSLWWMQSVRPGRLKPTAQVLAHGVGVYTGDRYPLVMSMRYGAGRSLYVGTDEIWRWRYARGEELPERFWIQLIRMLGRDSLARSGAPALLEVTPRRAVLDQPVRVSMELLDQSLAELELPSIGVRIVRERGAGGEILGTSETPEELTLRREDVDSRVYSATWIAERAGEWRVELNEPLLSGYEFGATVDVAPPDDELRHPETDHEALARLSEATGGRVFRASELRELLADPEHLPKRKVVTHNEVAESLWDTPLALILLVSLLTVEWVGRRVIRLI